jgi:hypothetical protein
MAATSLERFSELPQPLIGVICDQIQSLRDVLRFSQTCKLVYAVVRERLLKRLHEFRPDIAGIVTEQLIDMAYDTFQLPYCVILEFRQLQEISKLLPCARVGLGTRCSPHIDRERVLHAYTPSGPQYAHLKVHKSTSGILADFGPFLKAHRHLGVKCTDVRSVEHRFESLKRVIVAAVSECTDTLFVDLPVLSGSTVMYLAQSTMSARLDITSSDKTPNTVGGLLVTTVRMELGSPALVQEVANMCMGQCNARFAGLKELVAAYFSGVQLPPSPQAPTITKLPDALPVPVLKRPRLN